MKKAALTMLAALAQLGAFGQPLDQAFRTPPDSAKPWTYWFWINGNINREEISRDLESMKRAGINGVLWMEASSLWHAPEGAVGVGSPEWHGCMQWAIEEADRLGMEFALSVDCGYGCGGPHITPDISMQELVWSTTPVEGGKRIHAELARPEVDYKPHIQPQTRRRAHRGAFLRPGKSLNPEVLRGLEEVDSYRDVAVFAVRMPEGAGEGISKLRQYDGRHHIRPREPLREVVPDRMEPLDPGEVFDLTSRMSDAGQLEWDAPEGPWIIIRLGHASTFKLTRPVPSHRIGLEADRMHPRGIETHFEHWLKPILEGAGDRAGRTLKYVHVDSWEAGFQNWTADFRREFQRRRGYDPGPWLPVLGGRVVESVDKTERFLWDMRQTVSEVLLENFIGRLKELLVPYGVELSCEPYGRVAINNAEWTTRCDLPIAEFWTERRPDPPYDAQKAPGEFPTADPYWQRSLRGLSSVANASGKDRVGAEAFTGCRGWLDHPFTLKGLGDDAFSKGINLFIFHNFAHTPYTHIKPGLTHRRWGTFMNRNQTWWPFVGPYFDYLARSQHLLQQGRKESDVAALIHEGAPLCFNMTPFDQFSLPAGYDYDMVTAELVQQMRVEQGRIHLPSGTSYRYLVLPEDGRVTLETAMKVESLIRAGAAIYQTAPVTGTPGLAGYPEADAMVRELSKDWPRLPPGNRSEPLAKRMAADGLKPDFEGGSLQWIHRRVDGDDIYFVANTGNEPVRQTCTFRVAGKTAELWDPETGNIHALPEVREVDARTEVALEFGPARSWFVVFRKQPTPGRDPYPPFHEWTPVAEIDGPWTLNFDPGWGTDETLALDTLRSWTDHADPLVKYYSGTGTYAATFDFDPAGVSANRDEIVLDLGRVDVIARVTLNGRDCGIAWKPPYRVNITEALQPGRNTLQVEVANTWVNRMVGDEQFPLDADWMDYETLREWPDWLMEGKKSPAGRHAFSSVRFYTESAELQPSGLLGPVRVLAASAGSPEATSGSRATRSPEHGISGLWR